MDAKKIYLAGPGVFLPDPIGEGARLKALCATFGFEGVFPMDASLDIAAMTKLDAAQAIYRANITFIESADAVIADMRAFRGPGMDGGTAFEMGYALALGKPVVGYGLADTYRERCRRLYGDTSVDPDGLTIEDFALPDNLMMACGATKIVADEMQALAELARML